MRHNRLTHKLSRNFSERRALLESLAASTLTYQQIQTTVAKAKEARKLVDRLITLGKTDTLHHRRQAFAALQDHELVSKLFKEIAPRFVKRNGGYTRIFRLNFRKGDHAQMALLELTEKELKVKEPKKKLKKASKETKEAVPDKSKKQDQIKEAHPETKPSFEKQAHPPKSEPKQGKSKGAEFFKNIGKFFRNKGGGGGS
jgi:large subunit ribosomal protein L17